MTLNSTLFESLSKVLGHSFETTSSRKLVVLGCKSLFDRSFFFKNHIACMVCLLFHDYVTTVSLNIGLDLGLIGLSLLLNKRVSFILASENIFGLWPFEGGVLEYATDCLLVISFLLWKCDCAPSPIKRRMLGTKKPIVPLMPPLKLRTKTSYHSSKKKKT